MREILLKMNTPEVFVEFMPILTHVKLVRVEYEVARPHDEKEGYVNLWFAKGFFIDGVFREAPGVPGVNLVIAQTEFSLLTLDLLALLQAVSTCMQEILLASVEIIESDD